MLTKVAIGAGNPPLLQRVTVSIMTRAVLPGQNIFLIERRNQQCRHKNTVTGLHGNRILFGIICCSETESVSVADMTPNSSGPDMSLVLGLTQPRNSYLGTFPGCFNISVPD